MSDERISEERLARLSRCNDDYGPHNFPDGVEPVSRVELETLLAAYRERRDEGDGEAWRLLDELLDRLRGCDIRVRLEDEQLPPLSALIVECSNAVARRAATQPAAQTTPAPPGGDDRLAAALAECIDTRHRFTYAKRGQVREAHEAWKRAAAEFDAALSARVAALIEADIAARAAPASAGDEELKAHAALCR